MKKTLVITLVILMSCVLSSPVYATLIDHGNGFIYDTDFDITWLQASSDSGTTWDQANVWATSLTTGGVTGWRLPSALNRDGSGPCMGFNCNNSEMGHLYYDELGNPADDTLTNKGPFTNLQLAVYWTDTEIVPNEYYWVFHFGFGLSDIPDPGTHNFYALAVHDGNVGTHTPIPGAVFLFAPGLVGLAVLRRKLFGSTGR